MTCSNSSDGVDKITDKIADNQMLTISHQEVNISQSSDISCHVNCLFSSVLLRPVN